MKRRLMFTVTALLLILTITPSALPAVQQSPYFFNLQLLRPAEYARPGASVGFAGSLVSTGSVPAYVNDVTVSLNAPFTLVKGSIFQAPLDDRVIQSGRAKPTLTWFTINLGSDVAPGTYTGTVTILGGRGPTMLSTVTSRNFQIIVTAGPPPPTGTQTFYDNFESGNAAQWTPVSGTWEVFNPPNQSSEYGAGLATDEAISLAGSGLINYSVEAWVNVASNNDGGICLLGRVQDGSHYYQLELKPDADGTLKWWLWGNNGGNWKHLNSGPFSYNAGTYYKLRLLMYQQLLVASYSTNGENFIILGDAVDDTFAAGKIGLRRWGTAGTFDQVKVVIY